MSRLILKHVLNIRSSVNQHEIVGIQFMRYVAALAVLIDHFMVALCENGKLSADNLPFAYELGTAGVYLFFAISGFVMVLTNRNKFQKPGGSIDFFWRRLIRIWPMYFIATMVVFAMKHRTDPLLTFPNLLKSLGFIPYIGPNDLYRPVLGKGWTLDYEMFFYAVFAICLAFPKKAGLAIAATALLALGLSEGTGTNELWKFYANSIVLYFLIGIALGYLVKDTGIRWKHFHSAAAAVTLAIVVFSALPLLHMSAAPAPLKLALSLLITFACLYLVCFSTTRFRNRTFSAVATLLGDASYSLYLFHGFFFFALKPLLRNGGQVNLALLLPVVITAVTIGCVIIHLYVEKPINRILLAMYKSKKDDPEPVVISPSGG